MTACLACVVAVLLDEADVAVAGSGDGSCGQPAGVRRAAPAGGTDVAADGAQVPDRPEQAVLDLLVSDPDVGGERLETDALAGEVLTGVDGPRVGTRHHRRLVTVGWGGTVQWYVSRGLYEIETVEIFTEC